MATVCVEDYRALAQKRLPRFLFDYIDGGSYGEHTLRANVADLQGISLRQRILRDMSQIDLSTRLFGDQYSLPFGLGPVGLAGMFARRGECQAVEAAEAAGVPFCLSTMSVCALPEVARVARAPFWFQLYIVRDRNFVSDILAQAQAIGCKVLVLTVDLPVPGARYRDYRSGLSGSSGVRRIAQRYSAAMLKPRWVWDVGLLGHPHTLGNVAPVLAGKSGLADVLQWAGRNFDASVTWDDLAFLRERWPGSLVIKGILDPQDAQYASQIGVDGIVVSNHGGRQLDGAPSTARALSAIADAVGDTLTILADGGVRSGLDVIRLLGLGAHGVLLGRAWAFALAAGGRGAIVDMLAGMEAELRVAMALTGVRSVRELDRSILAKSPG